MLLVALFITNVVLCGQLALGVVALKAENWPIWAVPLLVAMSYPVTFLTAGMSPRLLFCLGNALVGLCHYHHAQTGLSLLLCVVGLGLIRGSSPRLLGHTRHTPAYVAVCNIAFVVGPLLGESVRLKPELHLLVCLVLALPIALVLCQRTHTVEFEQISRLPPPCSALYPSIIAFYLLQAAVISYFADTAEATRLSPGLGGFRLGSGHWAALHGLLVAVLVFPLRKLGLTSAFACSAVSLVPGLVAIVSRPVLLGQIFLFSIGEAGLSANLLSYSVSQQGNRRFWLLAGVGYLLGACAMSAGHRALAGIAILACVTALAVGRKRL